MRSYRIVASDLDGTLFDAHAEISVENREAIKELNRRGVQFVPCTGRTFCDLPEELQTNPDIRYYICSNGALLYDKQTDNRILRGISRALADRVFDVLRDYEVHITVRWRGCCYIDARLDNDEAYAYYKVFPSHVGVLKNYSETQTNFETWCREIDHVEMFFLSFHDDGELEACKKRLSKIDGLLLADPAAHGLEIFSVDAGKGMALYQLADLLGVDRMDTVAVGDSGNDLGMVEAAGLGLAVANACDALKELADEVICTNEEHAIDYIAKHYF